MPSYNVQKAKLKDEYTNEVRAKDFSNSKMVCEDDETAQIIITLIDFYSVFLFKQD